MGAGGTPSVVVIESIESIAFVFELRLGSLAEVT